MAVADSLNLLNPSLGDPPFALVRFTLFGIYLPDSGLTQLPLFVFVLIAVQT